MKRNRTSGIIIPFFIAISMSIAMPSKSIAFDYDLIADGGRNSGTVGGNGVDNEINLQSHDYQEVADYDSNNNKAGKWTNEMVKRDPEKYEIVFSNDNKKRNILSALRAKIRRSNQITDAEEKFKFAPVLSVEALNNLNGFFDNLATNIHTMESRNLLPNQLRLLGESEYRPRDSSGQYRHSAAYINSVRSFAPSKSIRKLLQYQPGAFITYQSHPMITKFNDDSLQRNERRS